MIGRVPVTRHIHFTVSFILRFQWDIKKFQPDFSISPVSGYITAGSEVTFDVTFHPREIRTDIHYENLPCLIEGNKTLTLTLFGSCVELQSTKEVGNAHLPHPVCADLLSHRS